MPVVDLVAPLPPEITDHVLARPLRAAGRGYGDKILRGRKLRVEIGVDGIKDFSLGIDGVHVRHVSCCRFQNRKPANTLDENFRVPWRHGCPATAIFSILSS